MIKSQLNDPVPKSDKNECNRLKKKYSRAMKPILQTEKLVDEDEILTFSQYLGMPRKMLKMGTLDYHNFIDQYPDNIVKQ